VPSTKNFLSEEHLKEKEEKLRLFSSLLKAYEISECTVMAWGENSQLMKAVEECAEFIVALFHAKSGKVSDIDLASEIADVMIIAMAAARSVGIKNVIIEMEKKIEKINLKLQDSESEQSKKWIAMANETFTTKSPKRPEKNKSNKK